MRIDHTALVRGHVVPGEVCEIEGYGPVPVAVVEAMLPDAFVAAVLTRGHDVTTVAHLGRRATVFQTTALDWSEAGCSTEGCPNVGLRETDHTIEWRRTHHTKLDELRRPCKACHRLRTLEGYTYGARDPVTGKSPLLPPVTGVDPRG